MCSCACKVSALTAKQHVARIRADLDELSALSRKSQRWLSMEASQGNEHDFWSSLGQEAICSAQATLVVYTNGPATMQGLVLLSRYAPSPRSSEECFIYPKPRMTATLVQSQGRACDVMPRHRHLAMAEGTLRVSASVCSTVAAPLVRKWKMFLRAQVNS